jgi:hypothetical protein
VTEYDWRPGREGKVLCVQVRGKGGKLRKPSDKPQKSDVTVDADGALGWDTFRLLYEKGMLVGKAAIDARNKYGETTSSRA